MVETALARSSRSSAAVEIFLTSAAHATRMALFLPLRTERAHELATANRKLFAGIHPGETVSTRPETLALLEFAAI